MKSKFYCELEENISLNGGLFNAHLHLDRAGTANRSKDLIHLNLKRKHMEIPFLHSSGEYDPKRIHERVLPYLQELERVGTRRADTFVDVTPDIGSTAIQALSNLKKNTSVDLRLGAYSPIGFRKNGNFEILFEEAIEISDFIGSLPERDEKTEYQGGIGFEEHCELMLSMGHKHNKPVHFHVDQKNDPSENGTNRLLSVMERMGEQLPPEVWAIHVISPSAYDEKCFTNLLRRLLKNDVGVICCPSAALSMIQLRAYIAPTHNSIARVFDMLRAGVRVRVGSDNVADMFMPSSTIDLRDEIFVLSNAIRFYDPVVLGKIATGVDQFLYERDTII